MWHLWERGESYTEFWWGNLRERAHWEVLGVSGTIIMNLICKLQDADVDLIDVVQDRARWRALSETETNFGFRRMRGIS